MSKRIEQLHRLHDGELDAAERARVEGDLSLDERAQQKAIADVGAAVRNTLEAASEGVDLWAGIEQKLRATEGGKVLPLRRRLRTIALYVLPALAAAAAGIVLFLSLGPGPISNACDVEMLDVAGADATVLKVPDHEGKGSTTVIWTTEE